MTKEAVAKIKYLRVSQRKMLGLCNLVRGQETSVAKAVLMRTNKKGSKFISKALDSAIANAKNKNMDSKKLFISKITADMGPSYKRMIPWSRGNARPIQKRTVHLTIILQEKEGPATKKVAEKVEKKEATVVAEAGKTETEKKEIKTGKAKVVVKKAPAKKTEDKKTKDIKKTKK